MFIFSVTPIHRDEKVEVLTVDVRLHSEPSVTWKEKCLHTIGESAMERTHLVPCDNCPQNKTIVKTLECFPIYDGLASK